MPLKALDKTNPRQKIIITPDFNSLNRPTVSYTHLVNLLNEDKRLSFNLSPFFVAVVAFCFSMTIGVLWEFYEFFMDTNFAMDTQKDTIIYNINSVLLNPENINVPFHIKNITSTIVNGNELNIGGYLDIGLIDTMKDLIVNFIGAVTFSVIGYFYLDVYKRQLHMSKHKLPYN